MAMIRSAKNAGRPTSFTALRMTLSASPGPPSVCHSSSFLCVCSTTTMAASTSAPVAMAIPPSDITLNESPIRWNGTATASTVSGMVRMGIAALGGCHEEQQDHHHHGEDDLDQRRTQVVDDPVDQLGAVVDRDHAHPGRQSRRDLLQLALDAIDDVHHVRALAHDDDAGDGLAAARRGRPPPGAFPDRA